MTKNYYATRIAKLRRDVLSLQAQFRTEQKIAEKEYLGVNHTQKVIEASDVLDKVCIRFGDIIGLIDSNLQKLTI